MFPDLSWSHMLIVLVVALVVVGPKDLPKLMRRMGQWTAKARGMADQFRRSFDEMARQTELDELRKELDELRNARPLADVEQTLMEPLSGPAVSFEPEAKPETAAEAPKPDDPAVIEHHEPASPPAEPAEPHPAGDLHPPQP
jgi:sec-independent protein translocase protein TatB